MAAATRKPGEGAQAHKKASPRKKSAPREAGSQVPAELIKVAKTTPLNAVPQVAGDALVQALSRLGYSTVEEALGVLHVAGRELVRYLGLPATSLEAFAVATHAMAAPVTENEQKLIESAEYNLGVALDKIPALTRAPDLPPMSLALPAPGPAPANVNHIQDMPPIRDQKGRGTCVAFASLAAYEHFLHMNGTDVDLSEQCLYWDCKAHDNYPAEGTWLRVAYERLDQDGCCLEGKWPYVPTPISGNEGQGPPPPGAQAQALSYRPPNYRTLAPTDVLDLKATLLSGRCVSVSVPVYNSLMLNAQAKKTGNIPNPVPGELPVGGHAICLVGYVDDPGAPGQGGGRFILRNSWGQAFGFASAYGPGYGTISYSYIARLCREAFAVA